MRTVTIRALLLSTASCILVGVLLCWAFARRFGPAKAESSERLNLLDNRLRQLEDTTTRLSRALELLSRKVDDIAKIPKDSTTPTQILKDPSIAPREMESSAKVWVPVPWEMRFAGGDPKNFTIDELIKSLDLNREQLDSTTLATLSTLLDKHRGTQEELFARLDVELKSAADDLEKQGKYFTRAEHDKYLEALKNRKPTDGGVTSYYLGGEKDKHFVIYHNDYDGVAHVHKDLRQSTIDFKNSIYELLVGPVPERPEKEQR